MTTPLTKSSSSSSELVEGRVLNTPSPQISISSSFLYDVVSQSLALRHPDSSFSLYPCFPPLSKNKNPSSSSSSSFLSPPQPFTPSPTTSSATFLHLQTHSTTPLTTLFLTSSPLLRPPSHTLLRFTLLRDNRFARVQVVSSHRDLEFDRAKAGVVFKVNHGVSVKLSGGTNVFAMYSVSNSRIWVFAVRLLDGEALKLIKCAVIHCCFRVFEIKVLFGFLILGEENGVRVFPLHPLVKGKYRKEKRNVSKRLLKSDNGSLNNGGVGGKVSSGGKTMGTDGDSGLSSAKKGEKGEKYSVSSKLRSAKIRQDSREMGALFVAFNDEESSISTKIPGRSVKAISIQALSTNKFVILDSIGNLHLLCLSYSVHGVSSPRPMQQLTQTMKVIKLAVFHDISTETGAFWISDGSHTVHRVMVSELDTSRDNTEGKDTGDKLIQTSVTQAIFTSEKIQDLVPLSAEAMLILGQGSFFAYAIP